jgi:hypothetical protein
LAMGQDALEVFGEQGRNSLLLSFQINKVQAFWRGHFFIPGSGMVPAGNK